MCIRDSNTLAPYVGIYLTFGDLSCLSWPYHAEQPRAAIAAPGAAPILVLGTTNDPSTPYAWAVAVATQLESGILVTRNGDGHTAYNKGNPCVDATVESYLVDGVVPSTRMGAAPGAAMAALGCSAWNGHDRQERSPNVR